LNFIERNKTCIESVFTVTENIEFNHSRQNAQRDQVKHINRRTNTLQQENNTILALLYVKIQIPCNKKIIQS